jgi:hypothetical protein
VKALTVIPGTANSVQLDDRPEPPTDKTHYELGARSLAKADRQWLSRLITRRVPLDRWQEAFQRRQEDIKVVLQFEKDVT